MHNNINNITKKIRTFINKYKKNNQRKIVLLTAKLNKRDYYKRKS